MTQDDLNTGQAAARAMADRSGYGNMVSDDVCKAFAYEIVDAVDARRAAKLAAAELKRVTVPVAVAIPEAVHPAPAAVLPAPAHSYLASLLGTWMTRKHA